MPPVNSIASDGSWSQPSDLSPPPELFSNEAEKPAARAGKESAPTNEAYDSDHRAPFPELITPRTQLTEPEALEILVEYRRWGTPHDEHLVDDDDMDLELRQIRDMEAASDGVVSLQTMAMTFVMEVYQVIALSGAPLNFMTLTSGRLIPSVRSAPGSKRAARRR